MSIEIHDGLELWKVRLFNPESMLRAGSFYGMTATNTAIPGADYLTAQYFPLFRGATFDRIGVNVQTAQADKSMRLGIYADDDLDTYPDRLVLDAGVVDLGTTGATTLVIEQHLAAGLYFLALLTDNTTAKLWMDDTPRTWSPLGAGSSPGMPYFVWRVACSYGALPDPFPPGGSGMNDAWGLSLRVAAVD